MEEQKQNLIFLTICQEGLPTIKMVTEAGIIGKIGLNSSMVGVCLNAVKATGLDASRLPVHLGLRMALECRSAEEAVQRLERWGMASSAHILVADADGSIGVEFTSSTMVRLNMDEHGRVYHLNNFLAKHPGAHEIGYGPDSPFRAERIRALARDFDGKSKDPSLTEFTQLFDDHANFPCSICRSQEGISEDATLFNIVMDLKGGRAVVLLGKPCQVEERIELDFKQE
jgi:isopenicillin-N N-acyltransferase-like protein